ncbi:C-type lectin fold [Trinorchestia longiramus]|nr:C-type lectin fold [Trinorchestia longiramus]
MIVVQRKVLLSLVLLFLESLIIEISAGESEVLLDSDVNEIVQLVLSLKSSMENVQKDQWEALQSLRFHLLSTRTGLKEVLKQLHDMNEQLTQCNVLLNERSFPGGERNGLDGGGEGAPVPEAEGCSWPAVQVSSRCLVFVADNLLDWHAAQQQCRSMNGKLAGEFELASLRQRLTDLYGIEASRVRWSVWSGAYLTLYGWRWVEDSSCPQKPVDAMAWGAGQPREAAPTGIVPLCMALDGFDDYKGVAVPCSALRRFVCDLS